MKIKKVCLTLLAWLVLVQPIIAEPVSSLKRTIIKTPPATALPERTAIALPTTSPIASDCQKTCPNGIKINCSDNSDGPQGTECEISLPTSVCDALKLVSGQVPSKDVDKSFSCSNLRLNNPTDIEIYSSCCAIQHELVHACKPRDYTSEYQSMIACEERDGNSRAVSCMSIPVLESCGGIIPESRKESCHTACLMNAIFAVVRIWDNCNCSLAATARDTGTSFNKKACCLCNRECLGNSESYLSRIPESCRQLLTSEDLKKLNDSCKSLPSTSHGCGYMAGESAPGEDPKLCPDAWPIDADEF